MIELNLINQEQSDIKYKISKFPDGQQNIIINKEIKIYRYNDREKQDELVNFIDISKNEHKIKIISHLNNWLDLEIIVCAIACLRELDITDIHLFTPYFVGARSDRKFEEGGNWYLKQVICPIINSLNFKSVIVLDAHSYVLGNLLNSYKAIDNEQLVKFAIMNASIDPKNIILVSPDAGASHKIEKIAQAIGYKDQIVTCSKERDTSGKLTKTYVPLHEKLHLDKDFIIIDDICDGGRTFINIADAIKQNGYTKNKIYLIVTHGIFSAGFDELSKYFDGIYCTNSYSDLKSGEEIRQISQKICKQLNVF